LILFVLGDIVTPYLGEWVDSYAHTPRHAW
jgi:hypothetical protein